MKRKIDTMPIAQFMKPSALRHAMRIDRDHAAIQRRQWQDTKAQKAWHTKGEK